MAEADITTLELVGVKLKSLENYRRIVSDELIEQIHAVSQTLKGARVLHINSTASGGGVAELLNSLR